MNCSSEIAMEEEIRFTVLYKECQKNHAATLGTHSTDGCNEYVHDISKQPDMFCKACGCHRNFHRKILVPDGKVTNVCQGDERKKERNSSSNNKEPVVGTSLKSKQTDGKQGGSTSRNNEAELLNQTNKNVVDQPIAKPQSKPNLTTKIRVDRPMTTLHSMPQVTSQTKAKSLEIGKTMASTRKKIDNQPSRKRKAPRSTCIATKKQAGEAGKVSKKPKRSPSSFFVFMKDFRKNYAKEHPSNKATPVVSKAGAEKWKSMSEAEKAPYVAEAKKRKAEYNKNMETYYKDNEEDDVYILI